MGHNKDNVVISCLNCNLRRRTMHYERYEGVYFVTDYDCIFLNHYYNITASEEESDQQTTRSSNWWSKWGGRYWTESQQSST